VRSGVQVTVAVESAPSDLDPASSYDENSDIPLRAAYEGLVTLKGASLTDVVPVLAQSIDDQNAQHQVYTFKLQPNVKFHDGTAFDAAAAKFGLQRTITLNFGPGPILGTQFVGPEADLGPIPAVTLLLKPGDRARNIALCQGFTGIAGLAQAQADHPNAVVIPLRWLLTRPADFTAPDCNDVVGYYDYFRAGTILGALATTTTAPGKTALDFSGRGPFLIEQFVDANGSHYLFVDLSRSSNADLARLGPLIARALVQQADVLTSNAQIAGGGDPVAHAAAASKSSMPGWLRRVCGVATSPLVHIAKILFAAVFPPSLAVITPLEAVTNAGCPTPA